MTSRVALFWRSSTTWASRQDNLHDIYSSGDARRMRVQSSLDIDLRRESEVQCVTMRLHDENTRRYMCLPIYVITLYQPSSPDQAVPDRRTLGGSPCIRRSMVHILDAGSALMIYTEAQGTYHWMDQQPFLTGKIAQARLVTRPPLRRDLQLKKHVSTRSLPKPG